MFVCMYALGYILVVYKVGLGDSDITSNKSKLADVSLISNEISLSSSVLTSY